MHLSETTIGSGLVLQSEVAFRIIVRGELVVSIELKQVLAILGALYFWPASRNPYEGIQPLLNAISSRQAIFKPCLFSMVSTN